MITTPRKCVALKLYLDHLFLLENSLTDIDDCVNHTCGNGGSCEDGVNSYSCNCLVGFTGDQCETGRMHVVQGLITCAHNFANLINMVGRFDLVEEKFRTEFESSRYQNDIHCLNKLFIYSNNVNICLQTPTTVLTIHAVMVERVRMVSTVFPVTARKDILEITVKQVNYCSSAGFMTSFQVS